MKIIQKLILLLIVFAMIIPQVQTNATLDDQEVQVDVSQSKNYKKLLALGFIKAQDSFIFEREVSRGALIKYILNICGFEEITKAAQGENPFGDVPNSHIYYNEILTAYRIGMIHGISDTEFAPDGSVSVASGLKVLLSALGYDDIAQRRGGYPSGFISTAQPLGLLPAQVQDIHAPLTVAQFVDMLAKALDVEMVQLSAIVNREGKHFYEKSVVEKETLLTEVFGIYQMKGMVEANSYTSLYGAGSLPKDIVTIDSTNYQVGETNASDLLGYSVEGYYKENSTELPELCYLTVDQRRNETWIIKEKDVIKEQVTDRKFVYYDTEQDKIISLDISKSATLIYNGNQLVLQPKHLCPAYGEVTLIDNDYDGIIDVIQVMDYRIFQVSGVSKQTYSVSDVLGGESIVLDPSASSYDVVIKKDGVKKEIYDIEAGDIISYAQPLHQPNVKFVQVSSALTTGSVTEIAEEMVSIDDREYAIITELLGSISLGLSGTFYMDFTGRIAAYDAEFSMVYGYLNALDKKGALSETVMASIFTENNRWVELELKESIRFNGQSPNIKATAFYDKYGNNTEDYRQLITYKVDQEGKITAINFPRHTEAWSKEERDLIRENTFRLSRKLTSVAYRQIPTSFADDIALTASTKIFKVPAQKQNQWEEDKSSFQIVGLSSLVNGKTYTKVLGYDANETAVAKVCVIEGDTDALPNDGRSNILIVDAVTQIYSGNDIQPAIRGTLGGEMMTIPAISQEVLDQADLAKGDIILMAFSPSGGISIISKVYNYSAAERQKFITGSLWAATTRVAGEIQSVDQVNGRLVLDYGTKIGAFSLTGVARVYIYDRETGKVMSGTVSDIEKGKYLCATSRYLQLIQVVIFQ